MQYVYLHTNECIRGGFGLHICGAIAHHHHRGQSQLILQLLHHYSLAARPTRGLLGVVAAEQSRAE